MFSEDYGSEVVGFWMYGNFSNLGITCIKIISSQRKLGRAILEESTRENLRVCRLYLAIDVP